MKVYIYRAALFCEDCGAKLCAELDKPEGMQADDEHTWDSDDYPKGPYGDGGGEADTPQHCDKCGVFLENSLTPHGTNWLLSEAEKYERRGRSWSEVADAARRDGKAALADWIDFYFTPGA